MELCCPINCRDIDIKIFSYLPDNILIIILQTNRYIKSLGPEIWKLRILRRYRNLPLPININYHRFYYKTKICYYDLFYYATNKGHHKILAWFELPENAINKYIESGAASHHNLIESYLKLGIVPDQNSVNRASEIARSANRSESHISTIKLLAKYQIYPRY